jgi:CubicO group peptidase (beta-lactamase class C family)
VRQLSSSIDRVSAISRIQADNDAFAQDLDRRLADSLSSVPARRHIQSFVLSRDGQIVLERYFRDRRPSDLSNIHSVTKSFVSTLACMAISDGALTLDTPLVEILGERSAFHADEKKRRITIEHLLTMTSGLDAEGPHDIDEIADRGESWIDGPLAAPLVARPGEAFTYNNGAAHVLGYAIASAVGMDLPSYAEARLFKLLGIDAYRWPRDPEGHAIGHGHLEIRPLDMLSLGQLYLDRGVLDAQQVLPADLVAEATRPKTPGGSPEEVGYGYLWWIGEEEGIRQFFAGGFGGQYIVVVPDYRVVAVTTGDVDVFIETSRNLRRLFNEVALPVLQGQSRW